MPFLIKNRYHHLGKTSHLKFRFKSFDDSCLDISSGILWVPSHASFSTLPKFGENGPKRATKQGFGPCYWVRWHGILKFWLGRFLSTCVLTSALTLSQNLSLVAPRHTTRNGFCGWIWAGVNLTKIWGTPNFFPELLGVGFGWGGISFLIVSLDI